MTATTHEPVTTNGATPSAAAAVAVCRLADLVPEQGVAALVTGVQVAIFRLHDDTVLAVDHHDPFSGANVIARGIVGTRGDIPTVASPMYKQVFDLRTGACLDDDSARLTSHRVTVSEDGTVWVTPGTPAGPEDAGDHP